MRPARFAFLGLLVIGGGLWLYQSRRPALRPGARLWNADLRGMHLAQRDLRAVELWGAKLGDATLTGAKLAEARLGGADLQRADLRGADLRHANLCLANLWDADLRGADLRGADLQGAILPPRNLEDALYDSTTRWPVGWDPAGSLAQRVPDLPADAGRKPIPASTTAQIRVQRIAARANHAEWKWTISGGPIRWFSMTGWHVHSSRSGNDPDGTIYAVRITALALDTKEARRQGYTHPGVKYEQETSYVYKYGGGSGGGTSNSYWSRRAPDEPLARVHLARDLIVRLPVELPLITVDGGTAVVRLGYSAGYAEMRAEIGALQVRAAQARLRQLRARRSWALGLVELLIVAVVLALIVVSVWGAVRFHAGARARRRG